MRHWLIPLLFYVQQLQKKIALLERKISLNNSSISGYKDSSLATTVYTRQRDIVASITSSHATEVVGEIFHTRKFCHTQVSSCTHLNLLKSPCFWYRYQPFLLSLSLQSYKPPAITCVPSSIGISNPTSHWYARLGFSFVLKRHPEIKEKPCECFLSRIILTA